MNHHKWLPPDGDSSGNERGVETASEAAGTNQKGSFITLPTAVLDRWVVKTNSNLESGRPRATKQRELTPCLYMACVWETNMCTASVCGGVVPRFFIVPWCASLSFAVHSWTPFRLS